MDSKTSRIRALNDQLRQNFLGGRAVITPGVAALGQAAVDRIVKTIAVFDDFRQANDPYEEHDFGSFEAEGQTIWPRSAPAASRFSLAFRHAPGDKFAMWARFDSTQQQTLIAGARDTEPVRGLTHDFYRYPPRFSPAFARAAIEAFTRPGDMVLDPFVGAGTTLVEALALGRDAIGIDISQLAEFVATAKTRFTRRLSSMRSTLGPGV